MSEQQPAALPKWTVTRIEDQVMATPKGLVAGKRVHYRLADGTDSYLDFAPDDFKPKTVGERIDSASNAHYAVLALESPELYTDGGV